MTDTPATQRDRPRKAPRQSRSRATVEAIVEAAARILETEGLDAFSTNAVAGRAGVSIGSLYQYFPGKDALIGALIVREGRALIEDASEAVAMPDRPAALSRLIRACVRHQLRRPALARLLDFEEARLPLDADVQAVGDRFQRLVAAVLGRPPTDRAAAVAVTARDVTAIIKGMVDAAGMAGERDQDGLAARVERAVFGYLDPGGC